MAREAELSVSTVLPKTTTVSYYCTFYSSAIFSVLVDKSKLCRNCTLFISMCEFARLMVHVWTCAPRAVSHTGALQHTRVKTAIGLRIWTLKLLGLCTSSLSVPLLSIFTALHTMQGGMGKMYVCPSVCQTREFKLWQNARNFCPYFNAIWKIEHPSFPTRRMVDGRCPGRVPEFLGQTDAVPSKTPILIDFRPKRLSCNT